MAYEDVEKVCVAGIDAAMAVDKIANKEGLFSLFQFSSDFMALSSVNLDHLVEQAKSMPAEDRARLVEKLKVKLVLHNKAIEAKIESGLDLVDVGISLAGQVVLFMTQVKALFS